MLSYSLISENQATAIAKLDAPVLSNQPNTFVTRNKLAYYIVCNLWLMLFEQYAPEVMSEIRSIILDKGLIYVIKLFSSAADLIVLRNGELSGLPMAVHRSVSSRYYFGRFDPEYNIGRDVDTTCLFLFRYPKRFSPIGADIVSDNSLSEFVEWERRNRQLQRSEYSRYIISWVRDAITQLIDWDALCDELEKHVGEWVLTSGATMGGHKSLMSKLEDIAHTNSEAFRKPFGLGLLDYSVSEPVTWVHPKYGKASLLDARRDVVVGAVPKTYKAARIIAPEETLRAAQARAVMRILDRYCPNRFPLHDQTVQQERAERGSRDGSVATLDLSHASDSITKVLFRELYPARFVSLILPLLGTHTTTRIGRHEVTRRMEMLSTAGNPLTFFLEGVTFLGICDASENIFDVFTGDAGANTSTVYGDDLAVRSEIATLVIEILTTLGFVVNEDKSFWEGPYRESCGREYLSGIDVTGIYFPRKPIRGTLVKGKVELSTAVSLDGFSERLEDTTTSLIAMQHSLFRICPTASTFLSEIVRNAHPQMTVSQEGDISPDLWGYHFDPIVVGLPAGRFELTRDKWGKGYPSLVRYRDTSFGENIIKCQLTLDYAKPDLSKQYLYDLYKYQEFLRTGPRYDTPLDKLLGVTSAPIPYSKTGMVKGSWVRRVMA